MVGTQMCPCCSHSPVRHQSAWCSTKTHWQRNPTWKDSKTAARAASHLCHQPAGGQKEINMVPSGSEWKLLGFWGFFFHFVMVFCCCCCCLFDEEEKSYNEGNLINIIRELAFYIWRCTRASTHLSVHSYVIFLICQMGQGLFLSATQECF